MLSRAVLLSFLVALPGLAGDSPQFRGADRTGIYHETGLLKAWPEGGPPRLWLATGIGAGYSSPLIHQGRIYVTGSQADQESYVYMLDLEGKLLDKIAYGKDTDASAAPAARCTPTIDGDQMFLLTGLGDLIAIDLPTKAITWKVNILERFSAPQNEWHLAEALLVDGPRVICTPGGPDAAMAALDRKTGETVWVTKGLTDMTAYVAPLLVDHNGRRIIFTETSKYLICVDANTGALLWMHEHPTQYDIHAVTPIYHAGSLYYVAGYKSGGGRLTLSKDAASYTVDWLDTELDCQHHGVVLIDGRIYGTSHHKGGGQLVCLDWNTGQVLWKDRTITQACVVAADGMLYTYEGPRRGVVSLVTPSATGLERTGQFTVADGEREHWAHPVIAHKRLYIRHGDALLCYDIAAK